MSWCIVLKVDFKMRIEFFTNSLRCKNANIANLILGVLLEMK